MSNENYLKKLFIDEAKPALKRHSGGGGGSGASNGMRNLLNMKTNVFSGMTDITSLKNIIGYSDTSDITNMSGMFKECSSLTEVPLFDISNVTTIEGMFSGCTSLTTVPLFDTSNVTDMDGVFQNCSSLTEVPLFDTSNVTYMSVMFSGCTSLTTVPAFDVRNASMTSIFMNCSSLTECWFRNIGRNLKVGDGKSFGLLLTVDSLIHLIYELRDVSASRTLTIGSTNIEKLANVYVKTIPVTDEMRAEDDLVDEKLPFVVCESTDEGAMLITDYVALKRWKLA